MEAGAGQLGNEKHDIKIRELKIQTAMKQE
jgi:hypothetical protein